jgi:hypothetical protein
MKNIIRYTLIFLCIAVLFQCRKTIILSDEKEILNFSLEEDVAYLSHWDGTTLHLIFSDSSDIKTLYTPIITISEKAKIHPPSGTPQVFSETGVPYVVTAQSRNMKTFLVKSRVLKAGNDIISFDFPHVRCKSFISDSTILVEVYEKVDLTKLIPTIVTSDLSVISPKSGVVQNFSDTVVYTVIAQNGAIKTYRVFIKEVLNDPNHIIAFSFPHLEHQTIIRDDTVWIEFYDDIAVHSLAPMIEIPEKATISPQSGVTQNFENDIVYTVTSESGREREYVVSVSKALDYENTILSFDFLHIRHKTTIADTIIHIELYEKQNLTKLVPTIVTSQLATVSPRSGVAQDFTNPVIYTVAAQNGDVKRYHVDVVEIFSDLNNIVSFSFAHIDHKTIIIDDTVRVEIYENVALNNLTPIIEIPENATINPKGGIAQNFENDVKYTVTSESGQEREYTVTVLKTLNSDNDILVFDFPHLRHKTVIADTIIHIELYEKVDLTKLAPTVVTSQLATVSPRSGQVQNFTNPIVYTVTAQNGDVKRYHVDIEEMLSDANRIVSFSFAHLDYKTTIVEDTVRIEVYENVPLNNLRPIIEISEKATITPGSGVAQNFETDVNYVVTSESELQRNFVVKTTKVLDTNKAILSFAIPNRTSNITFRGDTIDVEVYAFVDVSSLAPIISISPKATIFPQSGQAVNFTNPVTYTITAQDGGTSKYVVKVYKALSRRNEIESFSLTGTQQIFEREGDNLFIYVPHETNITNIQTNIVISDLATISPANGTFMDFTNPQIYTVTSSDGTPRNYLVTVKRSPWKRVRTRPYTLRDGAGFVDFNGKMWVVGGWNHGWDNPSEQVQSEIWNSSDGINWERLPDAPWPGRHGGGTVVFNNAIWVISGTNAADVWKSEDGINWTLVTNTAPWGIRYAPYVAVFNNKLWVMGGISWLDDSGNDDWERSVRAFNDVWSSLDGENWVLENPHANWAPRGLIHGYAVLNNELYIMGGGIKGYADNKLLSGTIAEYNDVWKTNDGIHWTRVIQHASWEPRTHFSITAFNGNIFITDGSVGTQAGLSNETWYSSNGQDWNRVKYPFWRGTHASSLGVFNNQLWLVAGYHFESIWSLNFNDL